MSAPNEPRVKPKMLVALGIVVVAVLAFVFVVNPLLLGGDEEDLALPVPTGPRPPVASPAPDVDEDVPESFEVFSARDPFQQLVSFDGTPGPGSTPIPAPPSDGDAGETHLALTGVILDGGGTPRAVLVVDGVEHQPAEGEQFAGRLSLVDIAEQCATVAVGDARVALCAGEEIRA